MFQSRKIMVLLLICLSFSACVPWAAEWSKSSSKTRQTRGVYHRIKSGETLWSIARAYQASVQDLAEINDISDPNLIEVDDVIFIPDANQVIDNIIPSARRSEVPVRMDKKQESSPVAKPPEGDVNTSQVSVKEEPPPSTEKTEQTVKQKTGGERKQPIQFDRKRFIWPVTGKVISRFGIQPNGMYYNGVTIAAMEGTPVLAAAGGTVIFSASLKDYGETMIIKHEDSYMTVYTNLGCRIREADDKVRKGDKIALLGKSEKKGEGYLCFEIRHKNKARNPLFFLP